MTSARPSTSPTDADLYLAFRQAKTALDFEKTRWSSGCVSRAATIVRHACTPAVF